MKLLPLLLMGQTSVSRNNLYAGPGMARSVKHQGEASPGSSSISNGILALL